jgi:hypothetical protein
LTFIQGAASTFDLLHEVPVPGVDAPVRNLFGVSQILSWIAGQRAEISEDFEWRGQVHHLIAKLDVSGSMGHTPPRVSTPQNV